MKRRSTINKYKAFLEHLDSNHFNKNKITISYLEKVQAFQPHFTDMIKQLLDMKLITKKNDTYCLTIKGFDYLDKLKLRKFEIRQNKINETILIATIVIALSTLAEMFSQLSQIIQWILVGLVIFLLVKFVNLYR